MKRLTEVAKKTKLKGEVSKRGFIESLEKRTRYRMKKTLCIKHYEFNIQKMHLEN